MCISGSRRLTHRVVLWAAVLCGLSLVASIHGLNAQEAPNTLLDDGTPSHAADEPVIDDVRVSSFQGVTPGETSASRLQDLLGDAKQQRDLGDEQMLTYRIGPFPQVDVVVQGSVVASIVVHLNEASSPKAVAEELGLTDFRPAAVRTESGDTLGLTFPERGVTFSFLPETAQPTVGQLILEPITSEAFLLRVKTDLDHQYRHSLADLDYAEKIDPENYEVFSLRAQIMLDAGKFRGAVAAAESAINLNPQDGRALVVRAAALAELDEYERASRDLKTILSDESIDRIYHAQAKCLLGHFKAEGPKHDHKAAIAEHQAAIKLATPLGTDNRVEVRRVAKHILIDSHLAVARSIAHGQWQNKQETMEKWMRNASELAQATIDNDGGSPDLRLLVMRQALASYAGLDGNVDAKDAVSKVTAETEKLLGNAEDPLYADRIRWLAVEALHDAIGVEQARGARDRVLEYAEHVTELLEELGTLPESTPRTEFLIGRIYYQIGLAHAVLNEDHSEAVSWYERALAHFAGDLPSSEEVFRGRQGERFVSMGVSYWAADVREEAIALTRRGVEEMEQASRDGVHEKRAMAVPYGNLAAMYKALDKTSEARRMAAKAAQLEAMGRGASGR